MQSQIPNFESFGSILKLQAKIWQVELSFFVNFHNLGNMFITKSSVTRVKRIPDVTREPSKNFKNNLENAQTNLEDQRMKL